MISSIRSTIKSRYIIQIAVGAILVSFLLSVPLARRFGAGSSDPIMVNNVGVSAHEIEARIKSEEKMQQEFQKRFSGISMDVIYGSSGKSSNPKERAVSDLIEEALFESAGNTAGIVGDNNYVIDQLKNPAFVQHELGDIVPQSAWNGRHINFKALSAHLNRAGKNIEWFEDQVERRLVRQIAQNVSRIFIHAPYSQLVNAYVQRFVKRTYQVATFELQTYIDKLEKLPVDSTVLRNFYNYENSQAKRYWSTEQRDGSVWSFTPEAYGISVSDKKIEQYYKRNRHRYLKEARKLDLEIIKVSTNKLVQELHSSLKLDGSKFKELAKKHSIDKKTASDGGSLGMIDPITLSSPIERAANKLVKDGQISTVIDTKSGFAILKRIGSKPAIYKPLSDVKSEISKELKVEQFSRVFKREVRNSVRIAHRSENSVTNFIKKRNGKKESIATPASSGAQSAPLLNRITTVDGFAFDLIGSTGYLVKLTNRVKAEPEAFVKVEDRVKQDYIKNQAAKQMQSEMKAVSNGLEQHSFGSVPSQTYKDVLPSDSGSLDDLFKKGLSSTRLFELTTPKAYIVDQGASHGFVAQLSTVSSYDPKKLDSELLTIQNDLVMQELRTIQRTFIESLLGHATIKNDLRGTSARGN